MLVKNHMQASTTLGKAMMSRIKRQGIRLPDSMTQTGLVLFGLIGLALSARAQVPGAPPKTWVDPDTGHRIVRLTDEPGSASLYFNQNGYSADGKKLIYTVPN